MKLDLTKTPPGGWQYYQPETGWSLPHPLNHSFESAVKVIVGHRAANDVLKSMAGPGHVAVDLEAFTRARLGIPETSGAPRAAVVEVAKRCGFCGR
jgi:hypothetical protein